MQISWNLLLFFREKKKHYFQMLISIKYKFRIHRQVGNKKIVNLQIQYLQYVSNLSILFINASEKPIFIMYVDQF